jgi:hypothetical protein
MFLPRLGVLQAILLNINSFTPRLQQMTSSAHIFSKSKVRIGKHLKKSCSYNHLDNVSSLFIFKNYLPVSVDASAKIPKRRRWG